KLLFSEHKSDYGHYIFPYAIWAVPEDGETAGDFFARGFLPSSREMDRFYLCRNVRVDLRKHRPSSENRRILRKGDGITAALVSRADFDYTPQRRDFFKTYADIKFGKDTMTSERLDALFAGRITSHVLVFTDNKTGNEIGAVTLYLEGDHLAYYYYAFYDLNYYSRNLGMFMMTFAVEFFKERSEERRVGKECRYWRDWNSDVCSSDLRRSPRVLLLRVLRPELLQPQPRHVHDDFCGGVLQGKIGRASCRERV